jgi:hypothetical protein
VQDTHTLEQDIVVFYLLAAHPLKNRAAHAHGMHS